MEKRVTVLETWEDLMEEFITTILLLVQIVGCFHKSHLNIDWKLLIVGNQSDRLAYIFNVVFPLLYPTF